ncbi:hypothetical protein [Halioglobus maricola]|uniref:hypothetical protein n=1 Tax=Halioglobus maricola TaxID=2601894 RepID=UPI00197ADFF3|nr:hypothetical protein [Halioglobus maricola]
MQNFDERQQEMTSDQTKEKKFPMIQSTRKRYNRSGRLRDVARQSASGHGQNDKREQNGWKVKSTNGPYANA